MQIVERVILRSFWKCFTPQRWISIRKSGCLLRFFFLLLQRNLFDESKWYSCRKSVANGISWIKRLEKKQRYSFEFLSLSYFDSLQRCISSMGVSTTSGEHFRTATTHLIVLVLITSTPIFRSAIVILNTKNLQNEPHYWMNDVYGVSNSHRTVVSTLHRGNLYVILNNFHQTNWMCQVNCFAFIVYNPDVINKLFALKIHLVKSPCKTYFKRNATAKDDSLETNQCVFQLHFVIHGRQRCIVTFPVASFTFYQISTILATKHRHLG